MLQEQAQGSDFCGIRPEPGPTGYQALARDIHRRRPKPVNSLGASLSQQPKQDQALASDLHVSSPETATSTGLGLRQRPPKE